MDLNVQRIEVLWLHRDTCAHSIITSKRSVIFTVMYLYYLWKKNSYGNVCTKGQSLEHNRIKMYLWGIRDTINMQRLENNVARSFVARLHTSAWKLRLKYPKYV